jgi:hypothetical protein
MIIQFFSIDFRQKQSTRKLVSMENCCDCFISWVFMFTMGVHVHHGCSCSPWVFMFTMGVHVHHGCSGSPVSMENCCDSDCFISWVFRFTMGVHVHHGCSGSPVSMENCCDRFMSWVFMIILCLLKCYIWHDRKYTKSRPNFFSTEGEKIKPTIRFLFCITR